MQEPSELHDKQGAWHITQVFVLLIREYPSAHAIQLLEIQNAQPAMLQVVHAPPIDINPELQTPQISAEEQVTQLFTSHEIQDIPSVLTVKVTETFELH